MSQYYEELLASQDPVQAAGWRRRIAQAVRFELALGPSRDPNPEILDIGCGPGGLYGYLEATGRQGAGYLGVECVKGSLELARQMHPDAMFVHGDAFFMELEPREQVFAIGACVDGNAVSGERERRARVLRMLERIWALARRRAVLIVLDQEALDRDAWLSGESALFGARESWVTAWMERRGVPGFVDSASLGQELVVCLGGVEREALWAAHERAMQGPWGGDVYDRAWMWTKVGAWARAREAIGQMEEEDPRRALLYERVEAGEG